jgi:DnaK suppressor protein
MKNSKISVRTLQYERLLLKKRDEINRGLRNHRLVDALAIEDPFDGIEHRNVDLHRFAADADVMSDIRSALDRIADGSFGVCVECGERIPARRLQVLPWARCCVSCQAELERRARDDGEELMPHASVTRSARAAA